MKRNLLFLAVLLCTSLMNAQPTPSPVAEPGAKGLLPQTSGIAPARERELPILFLSHVGFSPYIINGYVDIEANLSFPMVSEVGCEYYTVQYKGYGDTEWSTMSDGGNPRHFDDRTVGVSPDISRVTSYRLVLHGGEFDGYVSNTVTAKPISMASRYTGWGESPLVEHCMVDNPIGEQFTFSAETYKNGDITGYSVEENPDYFTYQWYRRNPNNWDMEKIEGATNRIYTPTMEDVGWQLILEVGGDKVHLDFSLYHQFGDVVCVPVQASVAYVGSDGFILYTDYVIPEPQKQFVRGETWMENVPEFDASCVSEKAPGQYVFRLPEEEYNYCVYALSNPAYFLTFVYNMGDDEKWYREAQVMSDRYKGILKVKAQLDGSAVPATIDVVGKDIDGNWGVVASQEVNPETGEAVFEQNWETGTDNRIFQGDYYVKARATDSTMETYYPATSFWTSASLVDIIDENMWNAKQVEINLQPMPAPLAGTGVIEGTVGTDQLPMAGRKKAQDAEAQGNIVVYLLDADNNIVAQSAADIYGNYRFDNVPFGSYTVVPNVDGYVVVAPTEVTLTAGNPIASDVNYDVTSEGVIPTGIRTTTIAGSTVQSVWSLSGIQSLARGQKQGPAQVSIMRMSDGTVKKVIMK